MKTRITSVDENPNGVIRKISFSLASLTPRVARARSKSIIHVSSKYESLDYDIWTNDLQIKEEQSKGYQHILKINIIRWILYLLTGLITGIIAFLIDILVDYTLTLKSRALQNYMNECFEKSCSYYAYTAWYSSIIIPALIGSLLVILIEPSAAGSGIPSVISHLNGVKIPRFTNLKALTVKICSLICTCIAGLASGKEGPFIYIGSTIGSLVSSLKLSWLPFLSRRLSYLNTVQEERDLMAGGVAAGVSAAFGSPVGATLMSLEEGTTFWSVLLMWRIFFCSIFSSFAFSTAVNIIFGYSGEIFSDLEKNEMQSRSYYIQVLPGQHTYFERFNETLVSYEYFELPIFFGVGIIGGLLGAFFVTVQVKVAVFRKRYLNTKLLKFIDTFFISFLTAALGISSMHLLRNCRGIKPNVYDPVHKLQMFCKDGEHNEMSVFWLQNQEALLKLLFHSPADSFSLLTLSVYFVIYFILFSLTSGLSLSTGIFIPSLLLGATWGRIVGLIIHKLFPRLAWTVPAKYALLGAAAQQGGIVRITISLVVVIIEATGALTFAFPLMLTLFTTKWVGDFFTEGYYVTQIHLSGIPILPPDPPPLTSDITAKDLMNCKVVSFPIIVSVDHIMNVLEKVSHHGFPVVKEINDGKNLCGGLLKTYGELRGFILRSQLMALLVTKSFIVPTSIEEIHRMLKLFQKYESRMIPITEVQLTEEERNITLDLRPYMNPSPYCVQMVMSFPRIFRLLKSLGLRHVIVVDNKNQVVGIISRKDLSKFRIWRYAVTMGLKELCVQ